MKNTKINPSVAKGTFVSGGRRFNRPSQKPSSPYIGGLTAKELSDAGYKKDAIDNDSSSASA